ncbi:hypothetical protein BN7_2780 [Wickerhamomyces ciferrii]|uniref:Uncharacterized protein n=1 Tax=Wickerhamomyces ciferrii (strain ATCC 14091 / BCRC 22168 / CBS 111 / JCM 3599 / NBRC 0793 / NRRL Y-1031 F-60-10) TaxID=1206466 RepID=K0KPX9_WICCF|nr:uncharacterized protein BN7_2780 [Wickerhamomyces ciferrii]CCH43233.1 hypothetical protein BN7_2780 [Wickerhamomyces ciferrii]
MMEHSKPIEIVLEEGQKFRAEDRLKENDHKALEVSFNKAQVNSPKKKINFNLDIYKFEAKPEPNISVVKGNGVNQSYSMVSRERDRYGNRAFVRFNFLKEGGIKVVNHGEINVRAHINDDEVESVDSSPTTPGTNLTRESTIDVEEIATPSEGYRETDEQAAVHDEVLNDYEIRPLAIYYTKYTTVNKGDTEPSSKKISLCDFVEGSECHIDLKFSENIISFWIIPIFFVVCCSLMIFINLVLEDNDRCRQHVRLHCRTQNRGSF